MKKVFYESWIAKHLLINNCTTITLLAWVFTKWSKTEARQSTINHECVVGRNAGVRIFSMVVNAVRSHVLCMVCTRMVYPQDDC